MQKFISIIQRRTHSFLWFLILTAALPAAARAQSVIPHLDCVEPVYENGVPTDSIRAHFGYTNTTNQQIVINDGSNNFFNPNPSGQYSGLQTTTFLPGFYKRSFSLIFSSASRVVWIVQNQPAATSTNWTAYCQTGMISYQGKLSVAGAAANQPHDFQFQFYDALTGGTASGEVFELQDVPVTNGMFSVQLDVEYIFRNYTGNARFLEIRVRPANSSNTYAALAPRQQLTAAPFALNSKNATNVSGGKVQIPGSNIASTCNKPSDYGQIKFTYYVPDYRLEVCTPDGWKFVTLQ